MQQNKLYKFQKMTLKRFQQCNHHCWVEVENASTDFIIPHMNMQHCIDLCIIDLCVRQIFVLFEGM